MDSCLRDFTRVNPLTFYESKVEKEAQVFIDEITKIIYAMWLSTSENVNLSTYNLKDVAQYLNVQWRDNRSLRGGHVTFMVFKKALVDTIFARKKSEAKVVEFIILLQGSMSVH